MGRKRKEEEGKGRKREGNGDEEGRNSTLIKKGIKQKCLDKTDIFDIQPR